MSLLDYFGKNSKKRARESEPEEEPPVVIIPAPDPKQQQPLATAALLPDTVGPPDISLAVGRCGNLTDGDIQRFLQPKIYDDLPVSYHNKGKILIF